MSRPDYVPIAQEIPAKYSLIFTERVGFVPKAPKPAQLLDTELTPRVCYDLYRSYKFKPSTFYGVYSSPGEFVTQSQFKGRIKMREQRWREANVILYRSEKNKNGPHLKKTAKQSAEKYSASEFFFGVIGRIDWTNYMWQPADDEDDQAYYASAPKTWLPLPPPRDVPAWLRQFVHLPTFQDWKKCNGAILQHFFPQEYVSWLAAGGVAQNMPVMFKPVYIGPPVVVKPPRAKRSATNAPRSAVSRKRKASSSNSPEQTAASHRSKRARKSLTTYEQIGADYTTEDEVDGEDVAGEDVDDQVLETSDDSGEDDDEEETGGQGELNQNTAMRIGSDQSRAIHGGFPQNGAAFPQNGGGFPQNSGGFPHNGGGFPQNGGVYNAIVPNGMPYTGDSQHGMVQNHFVSNNTAYSYFAQQAPTPNTNIQRDPIQSYHTHIAQPHRGYAQQDAQRVAAQYNFYIQNGLVHNHSVHDSLAGSQSVQNGFVHNQSIQHAHVQDNFNPAWQMQNQYLHNGGFSTGANITTISESNSSGNSSRDTEITPFDQDFADQDF